MKVVTSHSENLAINGTLADIDNPEEVGWNDPNCELEHPQFGNRIRDINKLHETLRCAFGRSVRHLPVDRKTITEVLRLTLETSGYYLVYNNVCIVTDATDG